MPLQINATMKSVRKTLASGTVNFLYWLIMLEGILMATPFGILLYSFYDPFLAGARQSELTAWVAAFFLPQSVYTTNSSFIEFMRYGDYLFYIGLAGFFVSAVPVYWAKLTRKGMVSGFIYTYVRHPQYLFFILSAFGLLFIWPRMMMLVLFLLMSVLYFYLAKFEERRMQSQYPEYAAYMQRTAMFIPGEPGRKLFNLLFGWVPSRNLAQLMAVLSIVIVAVGGAIGLRNLTIANISVAEMPAQRILAISIFPHDEPYLRDAVTKTLADGAVRNALDAQGNVSFTAHILPKNYGMLGKFVSINEHHEAEIIRNFRSRLSWKGFLWGTESDDVKVVLSKIEKPGKRLVPLAEIMDMSAKMTPVLIVDLKLPTGALTNLTITDTTHYGDVPQPIF